MQDNHDKEQVRMKCRVKENTKKKFHRERDICTRPDWPWDRPNLLYKGTLSFPVVKRSGRDVNHQFPLAPRLKKDQSYSSTPLLYLQGGLECYLCLSPFVLFVSYLLNSSFSTLHLTDSRIHVKAVEQRTLLECSHLNMTEVAAIGTPRNKYPKIQHVFHCKLDINLRK